MKTTKLLTLISVALMASLVLVAPSEAAKSSGSSEHRGRSSIEHVDPVKTLNARQKTPHAKRKEAARRLKEQYQATSAARVVQPIDQQGKSPRKRGLR